MGFEYAIKKVENQKELSKEDIIHLLLASGRKQQILFDLANEIRAQNFKDVVYLRGILEFSNYCKQNCLYCGIRKDNRNIERYRMTPEEIIEYALKIKDMGINTIVLQSGEDKWYNSIKLAQIIKKIKKYCNGIVITLSIGERSKEEYALFKKAGANRFLLKHETSDEKLFEYLRPGTTLKNRLNCLKVLKELGYEIGPGNIIGLPGQTIETIAEDILLFKKLNADMVGIGPFIPHPQTPLKSHPAGSLELTLKTIAITRIVLPKANIPATTAIATLHPKGYELALNCGANVIMPNFTPLKFKQKYQIYPKKAGSDKDAYKLLEEIFKIIEKLKRRPL